MGIFDKFRQKPEKKQGTMKDALEPKQDNQGNYSFIRHKNGEVCGIWLRSKQFAQNQAFLTMLCTKHSLPMDIYITVQTGDYRVVPNTFDHTGGCFVMLGAELAPGETVPSLETFIWRKGEENPASQDVSLFVEGKWLRYLCPTCMLPVRVERSKIDPVIGINIGCSNCKNISHVPGAFRTGKLPSNLKITGGVIVPIKEFSEWYFYHPIVRSLMSTNQIDLLSQYGLFGFCEKCFHYYQSTVLIQLPVFLRMKPEQIIYNAKTPESAKDFHSLMSRKCPSCGHDKMIGIITNIPDYVRDAINAHKENKIKESNEDIDAQKDAQNKYKKLLRKKS